MKAPHHPPRRVDITSTSTSPTETKKERCMKMYQTYHKKFPSIETLTSIDYIQQMRIHHQSSPPQRRKFILVDARSKAEQKVSMIPNAITLIQFEANLNSSTGADADADADAGTSLEYPSASEVVVTYCTIGYRSGLEAQRLRHKYHLNVKNLDGIVGYTHACAQLQNQEATEGNPNGIVKGENSNTHSYALVDPNTQQPTTKVHVFGSVWDVASDDFQTVWFSKFDMVLRGIGVGVKAFLGAFRSFFLSSSTDIAVG
jgi:rhodanese-related sulfurtransferase